MSRIGHAEVERLGKRLVAQHLSDSWTFAFDRAVRRLGCCHYDTRRITMSYALSADIALAEATDTLLHEIAHAIAGHEAGHGKAWKRVALSLGCNGQRTYDTSSGAVIAAPKSVRGTCPNCSRTVDRHRRQKVACVDCCRRHNRGRFDERFLFTWERI